MRDSIETVQTAQIEGRRIVDQAPVFSAQKDMLREIEIGARAVDERGPRLTAGCHEILRVKHESSHACKRERRPMPARKAEDVGSRGFVRVAGYALPCVVLSIE